MLSYCCILFNRAKIVKSTSIEIYQQQKTGILIPVSNLFNFNSELSFKENISNAVSLDVMF